VSTMQKITPFLWFDNNAEEAAELYVSIFKTPRSSASRAMERPVPDLQAQP